MRSLADSKRACVAEAVARLSQVMPPSVEYCHGPFFVPLTPLTAMPTGTPGSSKKLPTTLATVSPGRF
jgi:hypothetical protein